MTVLYTGTDPSRYQNQTDKTVMHCPLIKIVPRSLQDPKIRAVLQDLPEYTHLVFTSKNTIPIFCEGIQSVGFTKQDIKGVIIAVGQVTAGCLREAGLKVDLVAQAEHQEGIIEQLQWLDLEEAYFLLPRSSRSRPVIESYLIRRGIRHQICELYDTLPNIPKKLPNLDEVQEIVFTSPSTVLAFLQIFSAIPKDKKITPVGPITAQALRGVHHGT